MSTVLEGVLTRRLDRGAIRTGMQPCPRCSNLTPVIDMRVVRIVSRRPFLARLCPTCVEAVKGAQA